MQYVKLGSSAIEVSRLAFGTSHMTSLARAQTTREVLASVHAALDAGITLFDTADIYGQGDSERLLGRLLQQRRTSVVLSSKAGLCLNKSQTLIRMAKPLARPLLRKRLAAREAIHQKRVAEQRSCYEPDYLDQQLHASLKRLRTDYLDIFLLHSPPATLIRDGSLLDHLRSWVERGVVRAIGLSVDEQTAELGLAQRHQDCIQIPFNALSPHAVQERITAQSSEHCGLVAREPFAGGRLLKHPKFLALCEAAGRKPAATAIRYSLDMSANTAVLCGMNTREHVEANLAAMAGSPLPADVMAALRELGGGEAD